MEGCAGTAARKHRGSTVFTCAKARQRFARSPVTVRPAVCSLAMAAYEEALEAFRSGDNERARGLSLEALRSARSAGDPAREVDALCMLARAALRDGDFARVRELANEARACAGTAGDPRLERMPLHMQAVAARMSGSSSQARGFYEQSIALNETLGEERMVAAELHNLAYVELHDGRWHRARELFTRARVEARRIGYEALNPYLLGDLAVIAAIDHDFGSRLASRARRPPRLRPPVRSLIPMTRPSSSAFEINSPTSSARRACARPTRRAANSLPQTSSTTRSPPDSPTTSGAEANGRASARHQLLIKPSGAESSRRSRSHSPAATFSTDDRFGDNEPSRGRHTGPALSRDGINQSGRAAGGLSGWVLCRSAGPGSVVGIVGSGSLWGSAVELIPGLVPGKGLLFVFGARSWYEYAQERGDRGWIELGACATPELVTGGVG